jgi:hypothetical protein
MKYCASPKITPLYLIFTSLLQAAHPLGVPIGTPPNLLRIRTGTRYIDYYLPTVSGTKRLEAYRTPNTHDLDARLGYYILRTKELSLTKSDNADD